MKSYSGSPMAQSEALSDCTADSDGGGKSSLMRITTDEEYQTVVAMECKSPFAVALSACEQVHKGLVMNGP